MNVNAHVNHRVRQRRTGQQRAAAGVLAALLAGIALLAAACGGGSAGSAGSSPYAKALAYSQCMRSNGVANYPDPNAQGQFLMEPNNGLDYSSPQFAHAIKTCGRWRGITMTAQQVRQDLSRFLKYDACMRSHGITDMPDPVTAFGGVMQGSPNDANSPQFTAAEQACRSLEPGAASGGGS
jgi:hypothetical protein